MFGFVPGLDIAASAFGIKKGIDALSKPGVWTDIRDKAYNLIPGMAQANANEANIGLAREQMAFQEKMSSTAHQRQVQDLREAGLNPILSANSGASSPSGAMPTVHAEDASPLLSTAIEARRLKKEIKAVEQAVQTQKAQEKDYLSASRLSDQMAHKSFVDMQNAEMDYKARAAELPAVREEAKLRKTQAEIDRAMAIPDAAIKRVGAATGAAGNLIGIGKGIQGISNSAKGARRLERNQTIREERHLRRQGRMGTRLLD